MKYLVYRKRKSLEISKDLILLRFSAGEKIDPDETIKKLFDSFLPEDMKEKAIKDFVDQKEVNIEAQKDIRIMRQKDGSLKLIKAKN